MKEFNLSERFIAEDMEHPLGNVYDERDVKEFIKKLKEEIARGVKRNDIFPLDWCFDSIDELAGDKLI